MHNSIAISKTAESVTFVTRPQLVWQVRIDYKHEYETVNWEIVIINWSTTSYSIDHN